jgi:hypothetical protein
VNSRLTDGFLARFAELPDAVKAQARKAYRLWRENHSHPSLCFKRVHTREPMFSIRVSLNWRAVGLLENDTICWCWIGPHDEYMRYLSTR